MKEFLLLFTGCGIFFGGFFSLCFFNGEKWGVKKIFHVFITFTLCGLFFGGLIFLNNLGNEATWNNGKCPSCSTEWTFSNAQDKHGTTLYYWYCEKCHTIIELDRQF